jgi:hypothetical protein
MALMRGVAASWLPSVPEAGARHHRKRHDAKGAGGDGMKAGRRRHNGWGEDSETFQGKAPTQARNSQVQDEHQRFDRGSPAAPAREPQKVSAPASVSIEAWRRASAKWPRAQAYRANRERTASKRLGEAGSGVSFCLAIQLRVKLGTMRPPISATSVATTAMPMRSPSSAKSGSTLRKCESTLALRAP